MIRKTTFYNEHIAPRSPYSSFRNNWHTPTVFAGTRSSKSSSLSTHVGPPISLSKELTNALLSVCWIDSYRCFKENYFILTCLDGIGQFSFFLISGSVPAFLRKKHHSSSIHEGFRASSNRNVLVARINQAQLMIIIHGLGLWNKRERNAKILPSTANYLKISSTFQLKTETYSTGKGNTKTHNSIYVTYLTPPAQALSQTTWD